jgi:ribosomal protein S18 acetylase RimI-like enzyme
MKQITFEAIYTLGNIVDDNDRYRHFHYAEMPVRYDSNFIEFKLLPTLTAFKQMERYLWDYHLSRGQQHVKFYFPENMKPAAELTAYLTDMDYEIGFLELYAIRPEHFPALRNSPDITIKPVTEKSLDIYLDLQYKHDLEFGRAFAKQKTGLIKRQFEDPVIQQVLAFYKGVPAGYVELIISDETAEIDNLTVETLYRHKGIGSRLQKFAMDSFPEKHVILVADGENTPREMYRKHNYKYQGFKYEVQKIGGR